MATEALLDIESLDQEGRGVARRDGKVVFVEGGLPGEHVQARIYRRKPSFDLAEVQRVIRAASYRAQPPCAHFGVCGGCSMQHLEPRAQVAAKQRVLEDCLGRLGKVSPDTLLSPIHGPTQGYRHRARLSVRHVVRKGGALVGFRERHTHFIADMGSCHVLPARVSALIGPLRELLSGLSIADRLPQVEVAVGERRLVLVLRVLDSPTPADRSQMEAFARQWDLDVRLQTGGPDTLVPLLGEGPPLTYSLPDFGLELEFGPQEFTQVNPGVNQVLVRRAVSLLGPRPGERIADLFCGLGNFTLALASRGADVVGVEGAAGLVARATSNALRNGLAHRAQFFAADLFKDVDQALRRLGRVDGLLIDPPRDGAQSLVEALPASGPSRIVYVSCSPATLARDAGILVREKGYRLRAAGVVNMFPHTSHVESIAHFTREAH